MGTASAASLRRLAIELGLSVLSVSWQMVPKEKSPSSGADAQSLVLAC